MIVDRILQIIEYKGINKNKFYKETGLSNGFLDKVKDIGGNKIELILSSYPEIDPGWLITGKGNMIKSDPPKSKNKGNYLPKVVTVDNQDRENITLVPVKARAGYLDGYYNPDFIQKLPTYRMPGLNNGTFRAFEVKGQSMNLTLHNKSYAIGEWVENWDQNIKDDRVYIIVHEDWDNDKEGILIKRCLNRIEKYNNLLCKSDNLDRKAYPNINLEPSTIKEVWEVKGALIFEFTNPSLIFDRMNNLEADMEEIKRRIPS